MAIFVKLVAAFCGLGIGTSSLSPSAVLRPAENNLSVSTATAAESMGERGDDVKPGSIHCGYNHLSINVNGTKRKFILFVPTTLRKEETNPVIFVLHGALGDSNSAKWNCRMNDEAEKRKFFLIYPDAMGLHTWNAGACCGLGRWRETKDVEFIGAVIDYMESQLNADPKRIYVSGASNGGMMAYRLGIELSDKIAAISPVDGAMEFSGPAPKEPISVIVFHGRQDKVIRYDGEPGRWLFMRVYAPSVNDCIKYWVKQDQCSEATTTELQDGVEKQLYKNGKAGTEVCLYALLKGTHTWPGGKWDHIRHPMQSKKFSAAEVMCDFFLAHPKQTSQ
jgi:polyhydroxybutyrate depolymerase